MLDNQIITHYVDSSKCLEDPRFPIYNENEGLLEPENALLDMDSTLTSKKCIQLRSRDTQRHFNRVPPNCAVFESEFGPGARSTYTYLGTPDTLYAPIIDSINGVAEILPLFTAVRDFTRDPCPLLLKWAAAERSRAHFDAFYGDSKEFYFDVYDNTGLPHTKKVGICISTQKGGLNEGKIKNTTPKYYFKLTRGGASVFELIHSIDNRFWEQLMAFALSRGAFKITRVDIAVDTSADLFSYVREAFKTNHKKRLVHSYGKQLSVRIADKGVRENRILSSKKETVSEDEWSRVSTLYAGKFNRTSSTVVVYDKKKEALNNFKSTPYNTRLELRVHLSKQNYDGSMEMTHLPKLSFNLIQSFIKTYNYSREPLNYIRNLIFLALLDTTFCIRAGGFREKKDLYAEFWDYYVLNPLLTSIEKYEEANITGYEGERFAESFLLQNLIKRVNDELLNKDPPCMPESFPYYDRTFCQETGKVEIELFGAFPLEDTELEELEYLELDEF